METETNDIFTKGNKITTNRVNVFEVIDSNNYQVVLKDLLTDDFCVLDKAEHQYEQADLKLILLCALKEILEENDISTQKVERIVDRMKLRLFKWLP